MNHVNRSFLTGAKSQSPRRCPFGISQKGGHSRELTSHLGSPVTSLPRSKNLLLLAAYSTLFPLDISSLPIAPLQL